MKSVSFYHKETGLFNGTLLFVSDDEALAINTPADHLAIDGHHDYLSKRFDVATGVVVDYQPAADSEDHEWNDQTKRWTLSAAALEKKSRRPNALAQIAKLEAAQHRLVREALMQLMLGQDTTTSYKHLAGIEDEISTLRPIIHENI